MHRLRTSLALSVLAVATAGGVALAGPDASPSSGPDQSTDTAGDSLGLDGTSDILSNGAATTGVTTVTRVTTYTIQPVLTYKTVKVLKKVKGKKKVVKKRVAVTSYVKVPTVTEHRSFSADTLRLSITLAETPADAGSGQYYTVLTHTPACGAGTNDRLLFQWFAGDATGVANTANCSGPATKLTDLTFPVSVDGATIHFDVPLADAGPLGVNVGGAVTGIQAGASQTDPLNLTPVQNFALFDESDTPFDYTVG